MRTFLEAIAAFALLLVLSLVGFYVLSMEDPRIEATKQAQKHTEAHFELLEDQLQKLTDRIAALEPPSHEAPAAKGEK